MSEPSPARTRAQPLSPQRRREMIAREAVPLFLEHGSAVTTRQLAEHLGIAEGTIFRAFGDKAALTRAVVEAFFDQGRERMAAGLVDPALPLEEKIARLVTGTRSWMRNVMRMSALLERDQVREVFARREDTSYRDGMIRVFADDADELTVPLERMGAIMRIAGMAANAGRFHDEETLDDHELVRFILYGVAGVPARPSQDDQAATASGHDGKER